MTGIIMTMKKTEKLRKGDLVRIIDNVHDERLPSERIGILLEPYYATIHYTDREPVKTDQWLIHFTNGSVLHFHKMFIEKVK